MKKVWLVAVLAAAVFSLYACVSVVKDPAWELGKTYEADATEDFRSQDEILSSINEQIFTKGGESEPATTKEKVSKHERFTRISEVIEETRTDVPETLATETETERPTETPTQAQTTAPTAPSVQKGGDDMILHYSIDGNMMDPTLQDILYTELKECGMEWFMPYAVAQARAESGAQFSPYAVSKDGKDKGLFQYREKYWKAKASRIGMGDADIFNPVVQIYVYVFEVHSRYDAGMKEPAQLISAHKTAGYGYDAAYVNYVLQFVERLKIEKGR